MPTMSADEASTTERMVADSGSYELLKKRLAAQGDTLLAQARTLNDARIAQFGRSDSSLVLRTRARTENNGVARDLVRIGGLLLFGFNVFIGLRKETSVADVFALYRLNAEATAGSELEPVPLQGSFLDDPRFTSDFRELHAYYKQASLVQLRVTHDKLLASFRIGQQLHDVRVFRWQLGRDGVPRYLDNRGERDMALPASHDFEWTIATREHQVAGRHPHVNILDTVFVETVGGDLTVKIENNTETGLGIYSEPVDDKNQSLADADIAFAQVGQLVLLRVRPYREETTRYLVYNRRTQQAERIDAIGDTCVQLPEDHGIVFPGGCYLQSGEFKRFDLPPDVVRSLRFKRMVRSPNGEDVLYVFYQPDGGIYALFAYNLIDKTLAAPIVGNGYARFDDGRILIVQADGDEPTRVHPMQLWRTPFASDEHAAAQPAGQGFFARVGNAELVRGVSELMAVGRAVAEQVPTRAAYEDLIRQCTRIDDARGWLVEAEAGGVQATLRGIADAARATLAEFEKVDAIRAQTERALREAQGEQRALLTDIASTIWREPSDFMRALGRLRERRGQLQLLRELRYADGARIDAMDAELADEQQRVGGRALAFLSDAKAFDGPRAAVDKIAAHMPQATTSPALTAHLESLDEHAAGLDLLTEQLGNLPGGDPVARTAILDRVSALYADINRLRADARQRRKSLGATEAAAEFGAQFKLFGQAVENAVEFADTPEKCDEALTRLLAQLEELEGRFAEHDLFLGDIAARREAVYEALASRRQALLAARQRRAQAVGDAAQRILDGLPRRASALADAAQVHGFFAADPLVAKLRSLIDDLRKLGAAVAADELDTRLKTARDHALRAVRDQRELSADDGASLRLGRHRFTVNRQALDLSLVVKDGQPHFHINGSDYFEPVRDARLESHRTLWDQALVSETGDIARAEYLAAQVMAHTRDGRTEWSWSDLVAWAAAGDEGFAPMLDAVRRFAAPRYAEGYQKGVHDDDATRLLAPLVRMHEAAGLLAQGPSERALALLYWQHGALVESRDAWLRRSRAALRMHALFGDGDALRQLEADLATALLRFGRDFAPTLAPDDGSYASLSAGAAAYLPRQLAAERGGTRWIVSTPGADLAALLERELNARDAAGQWRQDLDAATPAERWQLARSWLAAYVQANARDARAWIDDAATVLAFDDLERERHNVELEVEVTGLRSEHARIAEGRLRLNLNHFAGRVRHHATQNVPAFQALQALRLSLVDAEKARLRLAQFQAKPLSSFVRNRLIDEVYLPLVGDNLAKQLGTAGEASRTDRMGLLLLISPPGYGKTTLMEYVADRLGMTFVRINGPALGHDVTSIDPAAATQSAAKQELEKLNLGLVMGNNVMLYVDDIQHTSPEFLQKFIALADGTRRIEGVWQGEPRTHDLRGKRFAIVMAGNPYTESGEVFEIPDMLANRADVHNLGDVLSGREQLFALSYLENALTANPVLLPLASREPADVHRLVRLAQGDEVPASDFAHPYGAAELDELRELMQRLGKARDVLMKVNLAYIESAAQQDAYRTKPPFKLQGSYRNMTKLAARITPQMRDDELDALLRDHYRGEAQTLTSGAEENLLALSQLLGSATAEEAARWRSLCDEFVRRNKLGGGDTDGSVRIASAVLDVARALDALETPKAPEPPAQPPPPPQPAPASEGQRIADALLEIAITYRKILMPLISATERRLELDHSIRLQLEQANRLLAERGLRERSATRPDDPPSGFGKLPE